MTPRERKYHRRKKNQADNKGLPKDLIWFEKSNVKNHVWVCGLCPIIKFGTFR
jgi:hypothetical protein